MRFVVIFAAAAALFAAPEPESKTYLLQPGVRIPLALISSISTKGAVAGDRVYLETLFPTLLDTKVIIPPGSYVLGTITSIKRPGKVKGRGEFHLRFDSLTLPNGVTRDFRAHINSLDGRAGEELDRKEGTVRSQGDKLGDSRTIAETAAAGAGIGSIAGAVNGNSGMGAMMGAGAGAAAGLVSVFLTRGSDAILAKGTTIEMVLDRQISFAADELNFASSMPRRSGASDKLGPLPSRRSEAGLSRRKKAEEPSSAPSVEQVPQTDVPPPADQPPATQPEQLEPQQ